MRFCFGEFVLDPDALLLSRAGTAFPTPRRVFDLIAYLLLHRQRAVSRDALIHHLWGHDNVTHHQLAQVVRAARQVLGDSGEAQRLIRTVSGFGYHWVGTVVEMEQEAVPAGAASRRAGVSVLPALAEAPGAEPPPVPAPAAFLEAPAELEVLSDSLARPPTASESTPDLALPDLAAAAGPGVARRPLVPGKSAGFGQRQLPILRFALVPAALVLAWAATLRAEREPVMTPASDSMPHSTLAPRERVDALAHLRALLDQGRLEEVREGLARLPAALQPTPEARLLQIELDLHRGRWPQAEARLAAELRQAEAAADGQYQARLWILSARHLRRSGQPVAQVLAAAQRAQALLESEAASGTVPESLRGDNHWSLARAHLVSGDLEAAQRELLVARDFYNQAGLPRKVIDTNSAIARVWMRQGRLHGALEQIQRNAARYAELKLPVQEVYALNSAVRIQIELLRWQGALADSDRAMQLLQAMPESERRPRTRQLRAWVLVGLGRLREASSLIEEMDAQAPRGDNAVPALSRLAAGNPGQALQAAAAMFAANSASEPHDILFEDHEGALLLWMTAAQQLVAAGQPRPALPDGADRVLASPTTTAGKIALGRWLTLQGKTLEAESILRSAAESSRRLHHNYQLLWASEALVDLLLQCGDADAAAATYAALRGHDPEVMDQDFQANLLELRIAAVQGEPDRLDQIRTRLASLAGERSIAWLPPAALEVPGNAEASCNML